MLTSKRFVRVLNSSNFRLTNYARNHLRLQHLHLVLSPADTTNDPFRYRVTAFYQGDRNCTFSSYLSNCKEFKDSKHCMTYDKNDVFLYRFLFVFNIYSMYRKFNNGSLFCRGNRATYRAGREFEKLRDDLYFEFRAASSFVLKDYIPTGGKEYIIRSLNEHIL